MSVKRTKKGMFIAVILWIAIIAGIATTVRYMILPHFQERKKERLADQTGSDGKYKCYVNLAADSFSGYCILRSAQLAKRLSKQGIKLTVEDDGADYEKRLKSLSRGDVDMAVFPVNSLIQCGADMDEFPVSIVYMIDETKGADAIIANKSSLANISDLNTADARIVLTPNSPSEFMSRVMIASFNLPDFPEKKWMIEEDGSADVYKRFRGDSTKKPVAYAMWEPDVSRALKDKGAHVLMDSSRLKGYIVDVLVVRREFLINNYDAVKTLVEDYARTVYANQTKMVEMVLNDADITGCKMSRTEAEQIVKGIEWKNTLENYAHFGLKDNTSFENIEDMIMKITNVLVKTGTFDSDPLEGTVSSLYFNQILKGMIENNFHPGRNISVLTDMDLGESDEILRETRKLSKLTPSQWNSLVQVGELNVKPINFGRGTSRVNVKSRHDLVELVEILKSWPQYYLTVTGRVRLGGNEQEALKLAKARADAAVAVLVDNGITSDRIRSFAKIAKSNSSSAQSVSFILSQFPY